MTARDLDLAVECARSTLADAGRDMAADKWTDGDTARRHGALLHALGHLLDAVEPVPLPTDGRYIVTVHHLEAESVHPVPADYLRSRLSEALHELTYGESVTVERVQ